jgi:hypothetical protein
VGSERRSSCFLGRCSTTWASLLCVCFLIYIVCI